MLTTNSIYVSPNAEPHLIAFSTRTLTEMPVSNTVLEEAFPKFRSDDAISEVTIVMETSAEAGHFAGLSLLRCIRKVARLYGLPSRAEKSIRGCTSALFFLSALSVIDLAFLKLLMRLTCLL